MHNKPHTEETKEKLRKIAKRLHIKPPSRKGISWSKSQTEKMRKIMKGRKITWGKKLSKALLGNTNSLGKRKPKEAFDRIRGEKSPWWRGGITPVYKKIRNSVEYKYWREAVFKRDNWTCIWCNKRGRGELNADHIKPFALYPALRFAIDNGRTLCRDCHKKTDTFGNKSKKQNGL